MTLPVLDAALSRVRFDGRVPTLELRNAQPFTGSEDVDVLCGGMRSFTEFLCPAGTRDAEDTAERLEAEPFL